MANKRGSGLGTILSIGCGVAAGIAIYTHRDLIRSFLAELAGDAPRAERAEAEEPAAEVDIVIDRSGEEV